MTVKINPSSPSETSRTVLRSLMRQQQRRGAASREPEKLSPFDHEDLVFPAKFGTVTMASDRPKPLIEFNPNIDLAPLSRLLWLLRRGGGSRP